ncbi:MAG: bifunctional (p)ppGpp synthetase/guanosine-3',5'-bis(diphosphate) 3'-pyrophosphohydrolase [Bacteroidales bacterium]|nr:bifunctional (p)ppGpp synthetase/guanosine-3',5'-bis(diphosphate) 3'-pyrophosphohydrolase [Bacteroidales bacterium]
MKSTEFTKEDFDLIRKEWESLAEAAKARCRTDEEFKVVQKAFDFANEAHKDVRRRSGVPYIIHPIQVAKIVVSDIGLGYKSIVAALLHDVVEDTEYTVEDIKDLFGPKVASLVDGLTKMKNVLDEEDRTKQNGYQTESLQAENFKKILLTMNDDVRVVLIKLADRLHNCRTIEFMPEHKRDKILSETMYLFIPLAHRLGLYSIKSEMENIWLIYKEPEDYAEIKAETQAKVDTTGRQIDAFIAPIEAALRSEGYNFTIKKRIKTPYSIWHKMRTKHVTFDQVYDLYAVRIVFDPNSDDPVKERKQCYDIFSTITSLYRYQPDRLRDWIKTPKNNGYEALHCTLMSKSGIWVEVQIRSKRMDDIAERGIAAHWAYKRDGYISENDSEMDKWLEKIQDIIKSPDLGSLELLDVIHQDLLASDIVVFTPKGEQRTLPSGATALDFAYAIHTKIGEHAIAAKVNMKLCSLPHVLHQGDQIEIITAQNAFPLLGWLDFVVTRNAKRKILDYFRDHDPEILAKAEDIIELKNGHQTQAARIIINEGIRYIIASCCNPIPGDPVVGFTNPDGSITVHKKSCRVAEGQASTRGDKVTVPRWVNAAHVTDFPVKISLRGLDRVGMLSDITQQISLSMNINMRRLVLGSEGGVFEGTIELFVGDRETLEKLISSLSRIDGIQSVVRMDL